MIFLKQISDFKLQTLEDKLNQAAELLTKNNRKNAKAAYIGIISELIIFFKSEYPDLNREPLKKLLTDLLEERLKDSGEGIGLNVNSDSQTPKVSRKRKTDALIIAAIELMIGDGSSEQEAIKFAANVIKKKNESSLQKLLKSYRSPLLPGHIRDLIQTLKQEGKKRFNVKQSAVVYLDRASQNIK